MLSMGAIKFVFHVSRPREALSPWIPYNHVAWALPAHRPSPASGPATTQESQLSSGQCSRLCFHDFCPVSCSLGTLMSSDHMTRSQNDLRGSPLRITHLPRASPSPKGGHGWRWHCCHHGAKVGTQAQRQIPRPILEAGLEPARGLRAPDGAAWSKPSSWTHLSRRLDTGQRLADQPLPHWFPYRTQLPKEDREPIRGGNDLRMPAVWGSNSTVSLLLLYLGAG